MTFLWRERKRELIKQYPDTTIICFTIIYYSNCTSNIYGMGFKLMLINNTMTEKLERKSGLTRSRRWGSVVQLLSGRALTKVGWLPWFVICWTLTSTIKRI